MAIVTILNILPIIFEYPEVRLISELNTFYNFDHNVFLLDSSTDIHRFIGQGNFTPQSLYVFKSSADSVTGIESLTKLKSKNTLMIVATGLPEFKSNLSILWKIKEIQRLQINMKIGIFFSHFVTSEYLQELFQWFKEQRIINLFAATYSNSEVIQVSSPEKMLNIFTYNAFGKLNVINATGSEAYFLSKDSNFQQHQIRLGDSFKWHSNEALWLTVFRMMNASFLKVQHNSNPIEKLYEYGIDFDIYPRVCASCSNILRPDELNVYPMTMEAQVIVVPDALEYTEFSTYLRVITSDEFFGYSLITITFVILFLSIIRYIKLEKIVFFQSVADVLNLLMNDNGSIKYQRLTRIEVFLIVPLTFVGFIIVNGILSNLTSYLTRPILQPQIKSLEEIYKSPFPIISWSHGWKRELNSVLTNITEHADWSDKIHVIEGEAFDDQPEGYNRSISFFVDLNYANMVVRVQKNLNIKGYHIPEMRFLSCLASYVVNERFLFFERLNEIILRVRSAGLYQHWLRKDDAERENGILKANIERLKNLKESESNKFPLPIFIVYGWLASVIVLAFEIFISQIFRKRFVKKFGQFCSIH